MSNGKVVGAAAALGLASLGLVMAKMKLRPSQVAKVAEAAEVAPDFHGVPLDELSALAKDVWKGISCTIDQWGFLQFNHMAKHGRTVYHTQMCVDEAGKLINMGNHFPNEWWSTADEFAKRANEAFKFVPKA